MYRLSKVPCIFAVWATVVAGGVITLARHGATPGKAAAAEIGAGIPKPITAAAGNMTLLMFLHPKCPCSRASVEELSVLMDRCGDHMQASVIAYQPAGASPDWSRTATITDASRIPGVTVCFDTDAVVARRYGAQTSGQVFLFDQTGKLRFEGGITAGRGHTGDNDGLAMVTGIVTGRIDPATPLTDGPVFGCPIFSSDDDAGFSTNQGRK
jgi:hypothetical protein